MASSSSNPRERAYERTNPRANTWSGSLAKLPSSNALTKSVRILVFDATSSTVSPLVSPTCLKNSPTDSIDPLRFLHASQKFGRGCPILAALVQRRHFGEGFPCSGHVAQFVIDASQLKLSHRRRNTGRIDVQRVFEDFHCALVVPLVHQCLAQIHADFIRRIVEGICQGTAIGFNGLFPPILSREDLPKIVIGLGKGFVDCDRRPELLLSLRPLCLLKID